MKFTVNITKKHVYSMLVFALAFAFVNLAIAVTSTQAYHPLQDIAKSSTDLTSVDANSNTVIDQAESAQSVPWSGITGKPAGFADNVDNEGIGFETDPTVKSWAKTDSPTIPGTVTVGEEIRGKLYYTGPFAAPYGQTIKMIHSSKGICFLTKITDGSNGGSWSIYIGSDSYWYLEGNKGKCCNDPGEAYCVGTP